MSFLNPQADDQGSMKIHVRSYSWSGGEKAVDPNDKSKGKKAYAVIKFYEGSGESSIKGTVPIPMDMAVIGVTFQLNGYSKGKTEDSAVSYFSNETTAWGQNLIVYKKDAKGYEVAAEGSYKQVKDILGTNVKPQYNVYFYDLKRKCIDRFCFKGSPYGEWKNYKKQIRADLYTGFTKISEGEMKEFDTGVAILPKLELFSLYTQEEREEIAKHAGKFDEYAKYLEQGQTAVAADEEGSQEPAYYEGENSQELPDAPVDSDYAGNDAEEFPF